MNIQDPFFILSAARDSLDANEITLRNDTLLHQIHARGHGAVLCNGRYDGVDEPSILVVDRSPGTSQCLDTVLRLARIYGQSSVLAVDANNSARLLFLDGSRPAALGLFTSVSKRKAESANAYTERDGRYWVCIPVTA